MKRILSLFLAVLFFIGCFSGCSLIKGNHARAFFDCISKKDFEGAYEHIWKYSPTYPTKEEFVEKYQNLFDTLGITSASYQNVQIQDTDTSSLFQCELTYHTESYGDITSNYEIVLQEVSNSYYVDFQESVLFPEMEEGDTIRVAITKGQRGEIFSSDGTLLATNGYANTVYVALDQDEELDLAATAQALSELIPLEQDEILQTLTEAKEKSRSTVELYSYLDGGLTEETEEAIKQIKGVAIDNSSIKPIRRYLLHDAAAHIIGYTGSPSEEDAEAATAQGKDPYGLVGKSGLELQYNDILSGTTGTLVYIRDSFGNNKRTLYEKAAQNGEDLHLSINADLQLYTYGLMDTYLKKGQSGAVIVMDADTGFLEAACSWPSFDNEIFNLPVSESVWESLNEQENQQPLYSRLTQGLYPPGSAFKPFTAAAALEAGAITTDTVFPEDDRVKDNKWTPGFENWPYPPITRKEDPGQPTRLENAMVMSDNIFFAYSMLLLGKDKLISFLEKAGMSQAIPFDLPVQSASIINEGTDMNRKLLADTGYGQGELLITPVQLAAMYTAFLNNGDILTPMLVSSRAVRQGDEYTTTFTAQTSVAIEDVLQESTISTLMPYLIEVMEEGTGVSTRVNGLTLAGKTGTAEIGSDKTREISWLIAFETEGDHRHLVLVMTEVPASKGTAKFAITRQLFTYLQAAKS